MRLAWVCSLVACSAPPQPRPIAQPPVPPAPVPPASRPTQAEAEQVVLATPTSEGVRATIDATSQQPCMAGTPGNAAVASYLASQLKSLGFSVEIREYQVYLPFPTKLGVKVVGAEDVTLSVVEPLANVSKPEAYTWNAYSANGSVTALLVDAGTASEDGFASMRRNHTQPSGKILLVKYGGLYRGAQIAAAERHGAAAVILWSDPKDEPKRPATSVQRGTVNYYWQYTGDPYTPGVAATKAGTATTPPPEVLPKIPVVTLSAAEVDKLRAALDDNPAAVQVTVELDGKWRTIRDVIATLPGASPQLVMLGNHYDGWVYGALDPHSGTATIMEIAKGLGALAKKGWKPARTIKLGFWDAEEFGVIGSTEWVEDERAALERNAVAYFNIDTIKSGALVLQGAPELHSFLEDCSAAVIDPNTSQPFKPTFKDIGIGSDWTAFLHHAGVSSVMWQTGAGPGVYSVWHSGLDDTERARTESDPSYAFIPAYAKAMGVCALRLATSETLPFDWSASARWTRAALDDLATKSKLKIDRSSLDPALDAFAKAADAAKRPACNAVLPQVERDFLAADGLVDRPWYRNLLTGPNPDNGYGALLVPELAGAKDQAALDKATKRLTAAITKATATLASCKP